MNRTREAAAVRTQEADNEPGIGRWSSRWDLHRKMTVCPLPVRRRLPGGAEGPLPMGVGRRNPERRSRRERPTANPSLTHICHEILEN